MHSTCTLLYKTPLFSFYNFFITGTCMTNELKIKPMSCGLFFYWLKVKNVEKNKTANNGLHITVRKLKCIHTTQQCMQHFFYYLPNTLFSSVSKTIVNILRNELSRCFILVQ